MRKTKTRRSGPLARLREELIILAIATSFLTRLPVPERGWTPRRMSATPRWYPGVGLIVGIIVALIYWVAAALYPPVLAALISTAAGLIVTGCFHEDGFADACDGLGGGTSRHAALEIMRDSRLGTYGVAGLALMLGAKILALGAMPAHAVPLILIAGHAASRASAVLVIATSNYIRVEGAGRPVARGLGRRGLAVALGVAALALIAVLFVAPVLALLGGIVGLFFGHALMRLAFERRLRGYTGDCLGAVQQTSEIGFYLGLLACL